jgi:hypothetical protein
MPIFRRKPKEDQPPRPPPTIGVELPAGEEVVRGVNAELIQAGRGIDGKLFMTNRRLMFEAKKGDARWMIVPFAEVKATGLYPAPSTPMGIPSSRRQCLFVETTKGEHVWWNFGDKEEREWLPLVQSRIDDARAAEESP